MTCMAPERFVDLLDRGGLDAVSATEQSHLQECDGCRDSWATVAAAGEILTESRPKRVGLAARLIPLISAAAILLTIVGVIAMRTAFVPTTKAMQDPLTLFLEGSPEEVKAARGTLLKSGRKALAGLVAARPKLKGSPRLRELQDLIWAIKRDAAQDPAAVALLNRLDTLRIDLQFENTLINDLLTFIRDFSTLNLVLDPNVDNGVVDLLSVKDATLRSVLEVLCAVKDLDFDVRYGVVFISKPIRLWSTDPALALPTANQWRSVPKPGDAVIVDKLRSVRVTLDIQNSPLSAVAAYLQEISTLKMTTTPAIELRFVTMKMQDLPMDHALELLTLPFGWDVSIQDGSVVFFDPKK